MIGVILAGGRASRLGGDKAGTLLAGQSLLVRAVNTVRAAGLEPVVCVRGETPVPDLGDAPTAVWREPDGPDGAAHPLAGMAYALERVGESAVLLPVDLPLLPARVLAALAAHPTPLAVLGEAGRPVALVVRAGAEHAAALSAAADAGAPTLRTLLALGAAVLDLETLDPTAGPQALLNVNDATGLAAAERALAARPPAPRT